MSFRALVLRLHGNQKLELEVSKIINLSMEKIGGIDPAVFQSACMESISKVEDIVQLDIFLYGIDCVDATLVDELASRSLG